MSKRLLSAFLAAACGGCMTSNPFLRMKPSGPVDLSDSSRAIPADQPAVHATVDHPAADSQPIELQPDPNAATIEALRRKSEAYAQALELLMQQRAGALEPRASEVQWLDPSRYQVQLGDGSAEESAAKPQRAEVRPGPRGAEGTTATAATPAAPAVEVMRDSNTPLALADINNKEAVALMTPQPPPRIEAASDPVESAVESKADVSGLQSKLARRVRENPRDLSNHLEYQMLLFLLDEPVPHLGSLSSLPQEDRELMTALLDGLSNLRATFRRDSNLLIAEKIRPVTELADRLRSTAELTIPTITLCSLVEGFGRYQAMEPRFIAGKESQTIVYCEIENFSSQLNQQQWETNLSLELSLFSEAGQQVLTEAPVAIADTSRTRRHDFFVRKLIRIPSNLPIGRYVLKVTIVDTQSNRVAEGSLQMQLVAQ